MISEQREKQTDSVAAVEPPVENMETPLPFDGEEPQIDENGNPYYRDSKPDPDPTDPRDLKLLNKLDTTRHKRNCGRTGPTTPMGRGIAARNATRHGMCSKTLILEGESEEDWQELLTTWLRKYQNPSTDDLLYSMVLKVAQCEWYRLRIQREHDLFYSSMDTVAIWLWQTEKKKEYDLMERYRNTAERRVLREARMLEQFWKSHYAAAAKAAAQPPPAKPPVPAPAPPEPPPQEQRIIPKILFVHNETGEMQDAQGNDYPPPPDYKPEPIIPGQYPLDHPTRFEERMRKLKSS